VENRWRIRYTLVSINEPPPDALFTWTPPDNFREVDTLESPMRRTAAKDMIGKPAPELTATTVDGASMTLSSMRGHPVLLDFWATWCVPCREQLPGMAKLYRETKDQGLVLLGIDDDETPEKALAWLKENHYPWPSLFDGKTRVAREKFKVSGIPTVVLIDRQGQIAEYLVGFGTETEQAIRAALRKQGIQVQ
jgi:cytochrome c biogenesis protein CcmG/thiol:disulfide interchange protein DsbE